MSGLDPIVAGMAGRYATALFELGRDKNALDQVDRDLSGLQSMMDNSVDLIRLVRSPVFGKDEQARAMTAVMTKAGISDLTSRFVGVVIDNRRLFALPDMIRGFAALLAQHRGEVAAKVISAHPLSDAQISALSGALQNAVGSQVRTTAKVDPDLLGGMIVQIGSRMIDTSLSTKLNNIQLAMKEA